MTDSTIEVKLGTEIEINFIAVENVDNFYVDTCIAMDSSALNSSTSSLKLTENGCALAQTDPVLAQIGPTVAKSGRQLSFNQFAFEIQTVSKGFH